MWSEAMSVLHEMRWRRAISAELALEAFVRLIEAPIQPRRPARLQAKAWEIASRLGLAKTYDAEYIALAQMTKCPVLTLDGRIARVAKNLVEILGPADL